MSQQQDAADCGQEGVIAGIKGGAWGLGVAGLSVGLANHFSSGFRSSLGVSGKTALIVCPTLPPISPVYGAATKAGWTWPYLTVSRHLAGAERLLQAVCS